MKGRQEQLVETESLSMICKMGTCGKNCKHWVFFFPFYYSELTTSGWLLKPETKKHSCKMKPSLISVWLLRTAAERYVQYKTDQMLSKRKINFQIRIWWRDKGDLIADVKTIVSDEGPEVRNSDIKNLQGYGKWKRHNRNKSKMRRGYRIVDDFISELWLYFSAL